MKTSSKILLGAAGAGLIGFFAYKNGIRNLHITLNGIESAEGGRIRVRLKVDNQNRFFPYPVPRLLVNAFGSDGGFIGTILNNQPQFIPANGVSYIYGEIAPNYTTLVTLIMNLISGFNAPSELTFHGVIFGPLGIEIPFEKTQRIGKVMGGEIKKGDVVKYANPYPDEVKETFLVLDVWDDGRCEIQSLYDPRFPVIKSAEINELTLA